MAWAGVGEIVPIEGRWNTKMYTKILTDSLEKSRKKLNLPKNLYLNQDNDPCHVSKHTRKFFKNKKINLIDYPPWSSDLIANC